MTTTPRPLRKRDFTRLGKAIHAERQRRGYSQADVAMAGGPSDTTQSLIEAGAWASNRPHATLIKLDHAYGWPSGTAYQLAIGDLPEGPPTSPEPEPKLPDTERRSNGMLVLKDGLLDDDKRMKTTMLCLGYLSAMQAQLDRVRVVDTEASEHEYARAIDHNIEQAQIALETAFMRLGQVKTLVHGHMDPEWAAKNTIGGA